MYYGQYAICNLLFQSADQWGRGSKPVEILQPIIKKRSRQGSWSKSSFVWEILWAACLLASCNTKTIAIGRPPSSIIIHHHESKLDFLILPYRIWYILIWNRYVFGFDLHPHEPQTCFTLILYPFKFMSCSCNLRKMGIPGQCSLHSLTAILATIICHDCWE